MAIQWRDTFNLEIEVIDDEHQKMVEIMNNLSANFANKDKAEIINSHIKELYNYADIHFKREEVYFEKYNYPETGEHKKLHKIFMNKVKKLEKDFSEGKVKLFEHVNFLNQWFLNHILIEDKKYSKYFIDNKLLIN